MSENTLPNALSKLPSLTNFKRLMKENLGHMQL